MQHISVTTHGVAGSPVILIPGLSSPRTVWDGVVPDLARSHCLYLIDVKGFAGDEPGANLAPGILDGVVAELHALIVRSRIVRPAVIGHSLGGLLALMLARAHPADPGKLMIVDSLPYIGEMFVDGATVEMLEPRADAIRTAMKSAYGVTMPADALQAIGEHNALTPAAREKVAEWVGKADARVSGEAIYAGLTTDLRPYVGAIEIPVTVVYPWSAAGMGEERATALYTEAYRAVPDITFVAMANSGHFVMLDQPAAFAATLDAFLRATVER